MEPTPRERDEISKILKKWILETLKYSPQKSWYEVFESVEKDLGIKSDSSILFDVVKDLQ
jgi:hypothetical protein